MMKRIFKLSACCGNGDGSGRETGKGKCQDGTGPKGQDDTCPMKKHQDKCPDGCGKGDGSGSKDGYGQHQDGTGPQGETPNCPETDKK